MDLKEKFLRDFSPYGKTHRQWIAKWADLKFNPDIDNIATHYNSNRTIFVYTDFNESNLYLAQPRDKVKKT